MWQRFGVWRRSRPFWGGVLTVLAGLELIGSMNLDLAGGHISIGQEGFAAYLVAFTLIIAGPLAWAMPAHRHFYGLIACFVAVYSLLGVNLGGFFAGMLLGIAGGGLIFAWTPTKPAGTHAAIGLVILALGLSMLNVLSVPGSASAACVATPAPAPTASPSPPNDGGLIGEILDWLSKLFGGGGTKTPSPSPSPSRSPCPSNSASPSPGPSRSNRPTTSPSPTGSKPAKVEAGQAKVGERPSRLTGTRVTMVNLNFDGVVDLPTASGSIRVLKFSMSQSDTDNFLLHVYGPHGKDTELRSSKLTVKGNTVSFYTNRFSGNLFGLIPVVFTPTSLPPPIPLPLVFFTNPDIQLVFVQSPILLAPNLRINQV